MALPVDTSQTDALNLQVLQRQDNQISELVGTASHVVVYEFDQADQSWKRKEVEGSLFVVKRYSAPHFQVFVNNRLSTVNLAIGVDATLNVDNVDEFLIIRCVDTTSPSGFKIYGIWFFPEEDRQKTLQLLERILASIKSGGPLTPTPRQQRPQPVQQQQQQRPQPAVVQEPATAKKATQSFGPIGSPKRAASKVLSKAEGIAAGEAILGMISQNTQAEDAPSNAEATTPPSNAGRRSRRKDRTLNKDQFKDALLTCLEDPAFLDQIYQAYAKKQ
ncbi:hypothetical protein SDRG_00841 [Saprolegnia diclina VS20]|uniref:mRNA-decapping enzyme C-terminal domain-containing protein n=1 Tax=Saprolegnia diclina (strain VS20) TaxID=1156394 RepID=T0QUX9_SAPDV|nr:hypothetical protein SDRG_00841 [Saprolegnia diclina VS20]EQC41994.1 hypothetical protein SDRG_00841 [Saprolegnia diclina VS20]|eukprot:XP_008604563.1 hypothetical protein SDRG_00841 [Saprolegnia diclina VS20]